MPWRLRKTEKTNSNSDFSVISVTDQQKWLKIMRDKYRISRFYYITPNNNLKSIRKRGILSNSNVIERNIQYTDISNPSVQNRREDVKCGGKPLHEFVPLFFAKKTPMTNALQRREDISNDQLCVLLIKPEVIFLDGVYFSNGNAAAGDTEFYKNTELDKLDKLNWNLINKCTWNHIDMEIKKLQRSRVSAEILVPDHIPNNFIDQIVSYKMGIGEYFFKNLGC